MEAASSQSEIRNDAVETIDFDNDEQVDRAFRLAVVDALREHKRKGQYVVGWKDGKVVIAPPEEIVLPEIE